jgi:hypothetical protein
MGLFKHFRSKSSKPEVQTESQPSINGHYISAPQVVPKDYASRLDRKILSRIFEMVCPHTLDTSYQSLDDVDLGDTCMLCDMRDLAECSRVCKAWHEPAAKLL